MRRPAHGLLQSGGLMMIAWALFVAPCLAEPLSPVGYWKTFSDKDNTAESIVQIREEGGELRGRLVKLFDSTETVCSACPGDKRDKPLIGLEIMWGAKKSGDEWKGGKILDPDSGDIYGLVLSLANHGEQLRVRGFIGFSLFGRTQLWLREK
jgi:uncharacterized protein (DUF2147 family)